MHGFNCAEACGILVSLTKDQTQVPCIGRQILKPLDHQRSLWIIFMSPVYLIPLEHLSLSQFLSTQFTSMGVCSIPVVYIQATFSHAVCYLFLCVWVPEEISFFLFFSLIYSLGLNLWSLMINLVFLARIRLSSPLPGLLAPSTPNCFVKPSVWFSHSPQERKNLKCWLLCLAPASQQCGLHKKAWDFFCHLIINSPCFLKDNLSKAGLSFHL